MLAAIVAVCVAQVTVAVPAVLIGLFQSDLGTTSSELTWIADIVMIPITLLELSSGVLGDLFGRKRLLVGGGVLVALGGAIAMLTPGAGTSTAVRTWMLCGGQVVTGIGAAALFATSLAMVAGRAHSDEERARSIALWVVALATGGFVSPLIGGLTAQHHWFAGQADSGWRWTFLGVLVLGLITATISWRLAQDSRSPQGRSLDWVGQVTIAVALFALLFAVIQGPTSGWASAQVIIGFAVAAVLLPAFVVIERRRSTPLLQMHLFANRAWAVSAVVSVLGMFAFLGTAYATAVRLASIQGFTPLRTAIAFVLLNGMALLLTKATSALLVRCDPRWVLGGGFTLIGVGDLWMAHVSEASLTITGVIAPLVLVGVGFALAVSSITEVAVNTVDPHLAGMASGSNNMLRNLGFTLGPAVIAAVSLTIATNRLHAKIAGSPTLRHALANFNALPSHVPAAQQAALHAAVGAVNSGPLGANAVPATILQGGKAVPFNPLKDAAFHALSQGYSIGYLICGIAALAATAIALGFMGARSQPEGEAPPAEPPVDSIERALPAPAPKDRPTPVALRGSTHLAGS
jgi:MFS family permease